MFRIRERPVLLYCVLFVALCLLVQWWAGAFVADRGLTADEAAHFVTAVMIYDFLCSHDLVHPVRFASAYYQHFPRVAIGHWPPFFHASQALFFFIVGPSVLASLLFQAIIAGLASGIPATMAHRRWGLIAGCAAGLLVFLSPDFLFLVSAVMIDNFSGLMVLLTALAWGRYWRSRTWGAGLLFALIAICATLTKGNALGLAFLPIVHAALSREIGPFRQLKTWVIAVVVGVVVCPWYLLTYKMTSDGFVYSFGWNFSSRALPAYFCYFAQLLGIPAFIGLVWWFGKICLSPSASKDECLTALLSAVVSIFLFQAIAPADIQPRYLISALPAASPLAIGGIVLIGGAVAGRLGRAGPGDAEIPGSTRAGLARDSGMQRLDSVLVDVTGHGRAVARRSTFIDGFAALTVLISIGSILRLPHTRPTHMNQIAAKIVEANSPNPLVLVCTTPTVEGAAIAALTTLERQPYHYVVRGTQALSSSRFMGTDYKSHFDSPDGMKRWLTEHQIGWLVVDTSSDSLSWGHNKVAVELLKLEQESWHLVTSFRRGNGAICLYALVDNKHVPTDIQKTLSTTRPGCLSGF